MRKLRDRILDIQENAAKKVRDDQYSIGERLKAFLTILSIVFAWGGFIILGWVFFIFLVAVCLTVYMFCYIGPIVTVFAGIYFGICPKPNKDQLLLDIDGIV